MATRVKLMRVNDSFKPLIKEVEEFKKKAIRVVKDATIACVEAMMKNTPVWEGMTVRNYGVGVGKRGRRSVVQPIANGPPGKTNAMSLGAEPRRAVNEKAAMDEIRAMLNDMKKLENVVIFNSVPEEEWDNIENARWPSTRKGQRVRNVAVVSKLGEQEGRAILEGRR